MFKNRCNGMGAVPLMTAKYVIDSYILEPLCLGKKTTIFYLKLVFMMLKYDHTIT